jgi:hypothetical protein
MNIKRVLADGITVFSVSLVVCILVTWLWNLIVHKANTIDWETSFRFATLFGIIMSWIASRKRTV